MSDRPEPPEIGRERVQAGASLDSVRLVLASPEREELDLNELLVASEIAHSAGDFVLASTAMELAVRIAPDSPELRYRFAYCLEQAGDVEAAEAQFRAALDLDPMLESAYASLAYLFLGQNKPEKAVEVLKQQRDRLGGSAALARQLAGALVMAGRPASALQELRDYNAEADATEETLRYEAEVAFQLGQPEQAIKAAFAAWRNRQESAETSLFLARLLCASGRYGAAADVLSEVLRREPDNLEVADLLVVAFTEAGDYNSALQTITPLIRKNPEISSLWYRAANLAILVSELDAAASLLEKAISLDPNNVDTRLLLAHLRSNSGHLDEAIEALDGIERIAPSRPEHRDFRLALLQRKEAERELSFSPEARNDLIKPLPRLPELEKARSLQAQAGGLRGLVESLRVQVRVITGLVMRDLAHRTVHSRFGIASAVVEPFIQVAMLGIVLSIFTHGRPPLGTDIFFFYTTGVLPFYIFLHVVNHSLNIFADNQQVLQVPLISRLDLVIASSLAALIIDGTTAVLVFVGFYLVGTGTFSDNMLNAVMAYLSVWIFGCGIGLNVAVLNNLSKLTERAWHTVQRVLYFISGIFFIAAGMPEWVRAYLVWNPLLVCVEWFRSGFFPQYNPPWLDRGYVLTVSALLIIAGLMAERAARRRFRTV